MRNFKWVQRTLEKIESQTLSFEDVEAAFDRVLRLNLQDDGSYQMIAETPSGRQISIVWRYDRDDERKPDTSLATWASQRAS